LPVLHLRPIPLLVRDERWGLSLLPFLISIFQFLFSTYREGRSLPAGGWPRLNSQKRLWVPHPCGFQGAVFNS